MHRGLRQPLQVQVERCVDPQTGASTVVVSQRLCQPSVDQVDEVGRFDVGGVGDRPDWLADRRQCPVRCHEPVLHHREQHAVAPRACPVGMTVWRVQLRCLDDARDGGRLTEGEVAKILAEERARPLGDPVDRERAVLAQVNLVQIQLQDARLRQPLFEEHRQRLLSQFSGHRLCRVQQRVLDQLLGQSARPDEIAAIARQIRHDGSGDPDGIDTVVSEEPVVLGGQHRLYHLSGNLG